MAPIAVLDKEKFSVIERQVSYIVDEHVHLVRKVDGVNAAGLFTKRDNRVRRQKRRASFGFFDAIGAHLSILLSLYIKNKDGRANTARGGHHR